jgi:hypothetical protein
MLSLKGSVDLLVTSTDSFLPEAMLTISQLKKLGIVGLFDCYLLLGDEYPRIDGFSILNRKDKGTWSSELRDGLLQLKSPYVFLWLDDFTPLNIRSLSGIELIIREFIGVNGVYLRLNPTPCGRGLELMPGVCEILPGEPYRTSTIFAIWSREALLSLLDDTETAWKFEILGSVRSDHMRGFYSAKRANIESVNLVVKGLIDPRNESILAKHGISLVDLKRKRFSKFQLFILRVREVRSKTLQLFPWRFQRVLRQFLSGKAGW